MRHIRSLRFDALETRRLLAAATVPSIHPDAAPTPAAVMLDGTLHVNVKDSSQSMNINGSWTTTVPVSGQLATMGKVHGFWLTTVDQFGNYLGSDSLELQSSNPKGSVVVDFNNQNTGKPHKISPGIGFYQHGQHLASGTIDHAKVSENGSIELMVDTKKGSVTSLVLISVNS